jgi:hypothetical protein
MSDVEADLVIGLRKLAKVSSDSQNFRFTFDGVEMCVDYVSGSSSRLTVDARYDAVARGPRVLRGIRPMSIKLRAEDSSDRAAKAEGISREHQTGDASFDEAIYIDSPTIDAALLDGVLSESVRNAAIDLVRLGFESIVIDDEGGHVTALVSAFGKMRGVTDAPGQVARAFAALLSNLPPVAAAHGEHPRRSSAPKVLAGLGGIALIVLMPLGMFGIAGSYDCTEPSSDGDGVSLKDGCGSPALLALVAALIAGFIVMMIVRALAKPGVSGRSDSHKQLLYVSIAAFTWSAFAAFVVTAFLAYSSRV